jgi:predicted PurR-regulated permease PerM
MIDARQTTAGAAPDAPTPDGASPLVPPPPTEAAVKLHIPAGEVARAGLVLIGLAFGVYLLWHIHEVIFLMFLGILLATAIEPIVNRLRRGRFSRGTGVLAVYTAIVVAIAIPTAIVAPSLGAQADAFAAGLPQKIEALRPLAEQLRPAGLSEAALRALDQARGAAANPVAPVVGEQPDVMKLVTSAGHFVLNFVTVFFLAFYWLVERASIKRALLRLVPPSRAKDVNAVWLEVEQKLGGWVRGQLLVMLAMGVMAGVGFWVIGLPNPILLAVLAGLGELVPMIGPFLAFAPAVFVALGMDLQTTLIVLAYAVVIQQIESNILVPRIMGHTVGVSPMTVLLGILIGAILYGLPGAFLAVPVAGAIQVILAHWLGMEDMVQQTAHNPRVAREAVAEAAAGAAARAAPGEAAAEAAIAAAEAENAPPPVVAPANRAARATPDMPAVMGALPDGASNPMPPSGLVPHAGQGDAVSAPAGHAPR